MMNEAVFDDLPTLETKRLTLRKIRLDDVDDIFQYCSDDEVSKYTVWPTHNTKEDTTTYVQTVLDKYERKVLAP